MDDTEESGFAIIYTRVSTEMQLDGMGIEAQSKECEKWCYRNEMQIRGSFSDQAKSGGFYSAPKYKTYGLINGLTQEEFDKLPEREKKDEINLSKIEGIDHREQLKLALKTAKPGDIFVSFAMSRIARNLEVGLQILNYLKEKKVFIVLVKDNLDSRQKNSFKMIFTMYSIIAETERNMMIDRVKSAMDYKKDMGEFVGAIPFGWRLSDGKQSDLVPDEKEQEIIKLVKEMRKNKNQRGECWGYLKIAKELNKLGHKTKKGAEWGPSQVARIVNDKSVPQRTQGSKKAKEIKQKQKEEEDIE